MLGRIKRRSVRGEVAEGDAGGDGDVEGSDLSGTGDEYELVAFFGGRPSLQ